MAADTPSSVDSTIPLQKWQDTFEGAVYDRQLFIKRTGEKMRGFNKLTVRKMGLATGAILASSDDGTGFAFQSMGLTSVVLQPSWLTVGHQYPDSLEWVVGENIATAAADNTEEALAAYIESQFLQDVASLTAYVGNAAYDADAAGFRAAVAQLMNTGKVKAIPGEVAIHGLLNALQHDDVMSIPEFTNADQRGDGQNPRVTGVVGKGNGVEMNFTTLLYSDANGTHGCVWVPSAFAYYFNRRPKGETQRYIKTNRVMADAHFAHNIVHPSRAIGFRTKSN